MYTWPGVRTYTKTQELPSRRLKRYREGSATQMHKVALRGQPPDCLAMAMGMQVPYGLHHARHVPARAQLAYTFALVLPAFL